MCIALLFLLNHAQSLLVIRLSCFVIVFLSRVNAQQWSRATQESSIPVRESGVFFLLFFSFFFFSCHWPFTVERYGCLCVASFKLLMKKIWLPNVMCFRRRHSVRMANACLKKANPRTESYTSFSRTPSVDRPYAFGAFPSSLWIVESARSSSIGFSFSAFFLWVRWNRNDTRAWSETTPKAWLRNPNTYAHFYCLIADGVRLLVNRWLFLNMFKTARLCRCSQKHML